MILSTIFPSKSKRKVVAKRYSRIFWILPMGVGARGTIIDVDSFLVSVSSLDVFSFFVFLLLFFCSFFVSLCACYRWLRLVGSGAAVRKGRVVVVGGYT